MVALQKSPAYNFLTQCYFLHKVRIQQKLETFCNISLAASFNRKTNLVSANGKRISRSLGNLRPAYASVYDVLILSLESAKCLKEEKTERVLPFLLHCLSRNATTKSFTGKVLAKHNLLLSPSTQFVSGYRVIT